MIDVCCHNKDFVRASKPIDALFALLCSTMRTRVFLATLQPIRGQHNIRGKTYAKDLVDRAEAQLTTLSRLAKATRNKKDGTE
jgi:hypothetical protein